MHFINTDIYNRAKRGRCDTAKVWSPFNKVRCSICQQLIDLIPNRDALAEYIRRRHRDVALVPVAKALYMALGQGIPDNLESRDFDEMVTVVANIAKDKAIK